MTTDGRRSGSAVPLACALAVCLLAGCKGHSPSQYIFPRITGRVVDARSRQPLAAVQVRHINSDASNRASDARKGAELLMATPVVRTAADGTFVLGSARDLALIRKLGWYSVSLAFEKPGYRRFIASYTLKDATRSARGEPGVHTGDILLEPLMP